MSNDVDFAWLGEAPKQYRFYNREVTVYYDDPSHRYYRYDEAGNDVTIAGVTSACGILDKSQALTPWAAKMTVEYIRDQIMMLDVPFGTPEPFTPELVLSWLDAAKAAHRVFKEAAATTGKIAHDWVESFIKLEIKSANGQDVAAQLAELMTNLPEDERATKAVQASLDWMEKHRVKWVFTERKIYSREHDFAGTMDALAYVSACGDKTCCGQWATVDGEYIQVAETFVHVLATVDWKSSTSLHFEYNLQVAAYTKAIIEELALDVKHRFIVRLGKEDGAFESRYLPPETLEHDFTTFIGCLDLYRSVEAGKAAEKEHKAKVKESKALAKEREAEAVKAERLRIRTETKEARAFAKTVYKQWRTDGLSVKDAEEKSAEWLTARLASIGGSEEEELESAA